MKKFIFIILIGLMLISTNIFAFTHDGEIDPNEFLDWLVVEKLQIDEYRLTVWIENSKRFARINRATLHLFGGGLSWYTYWKDGTLYTFEYNHKTDKFELVFVLDVE
jgi:hypothetical protein